MKTTWFGHNRQMLWWVLVQNQHSEHSKQRRPPKHGDSIGEQHLMDHVHDHRTINYLEI